MRRLICWFLRHRFVGTIHEDNQPYRDYVHWQCKRCGRVGLPPAPYDYGDTQDIGW